MISTSRHETCSPERAEVAVGAQRAMEAARRFEQEHALGSSARAAVTSSAQAVRDAAAGVPPARVSNKAMMKTYVWLFMSLCQLRIWMKN